MILIENEWINQVDNLMTYLLDQNNHKIALEISKIKGNKEVLEEMARIILMELIDN